MGSSQSSAVSSIDSKKQMCAGRLETIGNYLLLHGVKSELRSRLEYALEHSRAQYQSWDPVSKSWK